MSTDYNFQNIAYGEEVNFYYPRDTVNFLVKGTQVSATNAWTGNLPAGISEYSDGFTIDYYLSQNGTSNGATLNLGSKGAKPVYLGDSNTQVTNQFIAGSVLRLSYIVDSNLNSGNGAWKVSGYVNTTEIPIVKQDGITGFSITHYATCTTSADIAIKEISLVGNGTPSLEAGLRIAVNFEKTNTATSPGLKIGTNGEVKSIYHRGSQIQSGDNISLLSGVVEFVYDGTQWNLVGNYESASIANSTNNGTVKSWVSHANPATGPTKSSDSVVVNVNNISNTSERYFAIETDSEGNMFVNVPYSKVIIDDWTQS